MASLFLSELSIWLLKSSIVVSLISSIPISAGDKEEEKVQKQESVQQTWPKGHGERERDWNNCCSHFCMHACSLV